MSAGQNAGDAVPVHLRPSSCYVCGAAEPHPPTELHAFVTNAQVDAELAAERHRTVFYAETSTTDPAAHYVATYRPY